MEDALISSLAASTLFLWGYLIGSFPTGYLLAKLKGVDIRQTGSGSTGATNVARSLGTGLGTLVLVVDLLKGMAAIFLSVCPLRLNPSLWASVWDLSTHNRSNPLDFLLEFYREMGQGNLQALMYASFAGVAAVLGHNFPMWLRFRGGKGVATSLGVCLVLCPIPTLCALCVWSAVFVAFRYVSLASMLAALSLPLWVFWLDEKALPATPHVHSLFWGSKVFVTLLLAGLLIIQHRDNLKRLRAGKEPKFTFKKAAPPTEPLQ